MTVVDRSEMTLIYRAIMDMYPFPNRVVGNSIPVMKSPLYLAGGKLDKLVRNQEPTHCKVHSKPHPAPKKKMLEQEKANILKFTSDHLTSIIFLFVMGDVSG